MRLSHAVGFTVVIFAAAAAAVAWAPTVSAQQDPAARQERHNVVVTVDSGGDQSPQHLAMGGDHLTQMMIGGPRLGVQIRDVEASDVAKLKLTGQAGIVIDEVTKDSAAAKAGLKANDVVVQFDGESVRSARQFTRLVGESAANRAVKVGVIREGKRTDIEATLTMAEGPIAEVRINQQQIQREVEREMVQAAPLMRQFRMERQPGGPGMMGRRMPSEDVFVFEGPAGELQANRGRLGVTVQELTPELAGYFGVKDGVLVSSVRAETPAAKAGIKAGDVITTVNDKSVADANALVAQLRDKDGDVTIGLSRDKKAMSVKASLEKAAPDKPKVVVRGKPA
ncbi:MAG: PDZ domain-containing protein [Acidobacteriota bacterium]